MQIVLVPLDHRALGHGGILDRHQFVQCPARNDKAADVLRQMTRKAHQGLRQLQPALRQRMRWIEAGLLQAFGQLLAIAAPDQTG